MYRCFGRLDGVLLVLNGGGGAGKIPYPVHLNEEWERDIVAQKLEPRMTKEMLYIALCSSEQVIDTQHLFTLFKQSIDQVRA